MIGYSLNDKTSTVTSSRKKAVESEFEELY